ncbi:phage tail assembly chaperone G [Bacillus altitudinis]|uniref:phage tail assembly chaperone G n=1 Tax=Bacillus altitudinis TaxID=293387 RepID=UPI0012CC035A|nr:hypothetical protein [Bacillus altitudinis]VWA40834.1 hypothetical protein [Bacillus altitudinis]
MTQKRITIKLWSDAEQKEKTYVAPRTSAKTLLDALRLNKKAEDTAEDLEKSIKVLEEQIKFMVDIFGKQFTYDEFTEGLQSFEISAEISRVLAEVVGYKKIDEEDPDFLQPTETGATSEQ